MPEVISAERLAEAREAMEGEEWRKKHKAKAQILTQRREEARRAMEGRQRRLKRETAEAIKHATLAKETAAALEATGKIAAGRRAAQSAVEAERERATQAAAVEAARRKRAVDTTVKIERLKTALVQMSAIRTLKTDLAQAAADGATLTQAIISGQSRSAPFEAIEIKSRRGWLLALALLFFLLSASALGYYWYHRETSLPTGQPPATRSDPDEQLFVLTDEQIKIDAANLNRETFILKLRQAINDGMLNTGRVTRLIPTQADQALTLKSWLERLQITLPEKLSQVLEPKFLLGRYDDRDQPAVFLLLKTSNYEGVFAALRQAEQELVPLFYLLTGRTSFSSSTVTPTFINQLRDNLETRLLIKDGQTILLYAFLDQTTIVLTENENTLSEILNRRTN